MSKELAGKELSVDGKNKPRFDLIPPGPLRELAELYDLGARKYGDRNWENGRPWGDYYAAALRHLTAFWMGETHDPKDGQRHLASVAWLALALMEFEDTHPELDDRPPVRAAPIELNLRCSKCFHPMSEHQNEGCEQVVGGLGTRRCRCFGPGIP